MTKISHSDQSDIQSEEVQEIIGRPPHSVVRWGTTVVFLGIAVMFFISWFVHYPDLLVAQVTLTTTPPPVTLVSRVSGNLILAVADSFQVEQGQILAYVKSNANPDEVLLLEQRLLSNEELLRVNHGPLGDLQSFFAAHLNAIGTLNRFIQSESYPKQISQLKKQQVTNEKQKRFLKRQEKLIREELQLAKERFRTDSTLFGQRVTSAIDFNQARSAWLQQQRAARSIESELLTNESRQNDFEKQIIDLEIRMANEDQELQFAVEQSRRELLSKIDRWKESYLFVAPIKGCVAFLGFLENEQFIQNTAPILSIIPAQGKLVAKAELPIRSSGKAKHGQQVNIRLDNYPFEQFGMLQGRIAGISSLPVEGKYMLTIELPRGLVTTQHREIKFKQQLTGTTQVITEDLRLLERLTHQFKALLNAR